MSVQKYFVARQAITALALAALISPAVADEPTDVEKLIRPDAASIAVGASGVSGKTEDRANFGQYNGFRKKSGQLDLDVEMIKRDEATGTWTNLNGRNLGNENRELSFSQQKQGDWKYSVEYGELVRNYTNTINTGMLGIGSTNLTIVTLGSPATGTAAALAAAQGSGANYDFKTTRKAGTFGAEKWLTENVMFEASYKQETKQGLRMFGRYAPCSATAATAKDGYGCTNGATTNGAIGTTLTSAMSALLFLPEPIDTTTRLFEAKLNYHDDKLTLSGAYYGTFFTNNYGSLTMTYPGLLWNPNGSSFNPGTGALGNKLAGVGAGGGPMALPPDNQSHQLSLTGTYAITPTTRATFRYAFTHGTQKENFDSMGLTGGPRGALDGVVDTTTAQVGITSRPMPKLTVSGNLRYEQKSDKTPLASYITDTTTATATAPIYSGKTNSPGSHTKIAGKFEASYQLPANYRVTGGLDMEMRNLGVPTGTNDASGQAGALRAKTNEITYRGELRKSFDETFSGVIGLAHSFRNGSSWMQLGNGGVTNGSTPLISVTQPDGVLQSLGNSPGFNVFPLISTDLKRDKVKLGTDISATENLSLQFGVDGSGDHYYYPSMRGARDGRTTNLHADASYKITDNYKMNAWYSRGDTILDVNGTNNAYMASLRQLGHNFGLGFRGAPTGKLEIGGDLTFSYEVNRTSTGVIGTNTQPNAVPVAAFRQLNLSLFTKYAIEKNADIKLTLAHQRYYSNEWYWNNNGTFFFYSDGTTLTQKDQQNVSFLGAQYIYKFQ